jgi:ethanolamine utilization protein EutA
VPDQGIRATVIGASQYTVQVSGSTIYVEPATILPLRNVPVIAPQLDLAADSLMLETWLSVLPRLSLKTIRLRLSLRFTETAE